MNVHSLIHKNQKLETIQMSINNRMGKQIMAHSYNGIPLSKKKEPTTNTCSNLDKSIVYYAEQKKPYTKEYKLGLPWRSSS